MPYENNKMDSFSEYEVNLALINEIINEYKNNPEYNILIGGYFNAVFYRLKRFDNIFNNFVRRNKLVMCDKIYTQKIGHSYTNGSYTASLIDHVLLSYSNSLIDQISSIQTNTLSDALNNSDHNAVQFKIWFHDLSMTYNIDSSVSKTE